MILFLRKVLLKPLRRIGRALNRIENGQMDYRIGKHKSAREFLRINAAFNRMMNQIVDLENENHQKELMYQKLQIKSLQMQIRPHFLFNTFNLVHSMAELKDYHGVQRMMQYMTEYFRYTIRTGYEEVPLQKELAFLQVYCAIMSERYPDCFALEIQVDPSCNELQLPPLLIHTFVENVLQHTVRIGCFVNIQLAIDRAGDNVVLHITDNGEGITEEALADTRARIMEDNEPIDGHLGLWNCARRLELMYDGHAEIQIESTLSEGSTVTVILPLRSQEVNSYDVADL